eukprot:666898_1
MTANISNYQIKPVFSIGWYINYYHSDSVPKHRKLTMNRFSNSRIGALPVSITLILHWFGVQSFLPPSQIIALTEFYESLQGNHWYFCQWNLTELATNKSLPNSYCGLYLKSVTNITQTVYTIRFYYDYNLNGSIPDSIELLTDLEEISIWNNLLLTGIPGALCNIRPLWALSFEQTGLTGTIPPCIANMSSLLFFQFLRMESLLI